MTSGTAAATTSSTTSSTASAPLEAAARFSWRFRGVAIIGSMLVALLVAEGAMRVRQWIKYGTASPDISAFVIDEASGLRIPVPGSDTGRIRIDSRGFRNDELAVPKPPNRIRIAFLGASTTHCAEASSNEATWPHLVCARLREAFPGSDFDYVNAGVSGYSIEHSTRNLDLRVRKLEPDVIVFYEATNDMSGDTRRLAHEAGIFEGSVDKPSRLAKCSVLWSWIEKNAKVRSRMSRSAEGATRLPFDEATVALGYRDRLTALLRNAKEIAPVVAVATFCWQVRRDQTPERQLEACNTALYYMPWMSVEGLLRAMDAYNAAIRDAAGASGACLIEGEHEIPGDRSHFVDSVHFNDLGCRAMADRIAKRLIVMPGLRELVAAKLRIHAEE